MIATTIKENYSDYLEILKTITNIKSAFTNPKDVETAIKHCKNFFEQHLENYKIFFDKQQNLVAVPQQIDQEKTLIFLSAHIDTVEADESQWDAPYSPWKVHESKTELVARGINDCKAGVAYQLYLAKLLSEGKIKSINIIFTITFKEEGVGEKTSQEIGRQIGTKLPINAQNYLIVLENNVRVATPPILCIYNRERSNFVVKLTGTIADLQTQLLKLEKWNPVSIHPVNPSVQQSPETFTQKGGHVCSITRAENKLTEVILNSDNQSVIEAGDSQSFAVIPTQITRSKTDKPQIHHMVIGNRSFDSKTEILKQLSGIKYEELKSFQVSQGFNVEEKFQNDHIKHLIEQTATNSDIKTELTFNVGASDGSIIYNSIPQEHKDKILPLVMGPGCRSQRKATPPRLTHGKNETFDKQSGLQAIQFISTVLYEMGNLNT